MCWCVTVGMFDGVFCWSFLFSANRAVVVVDYVAGPASGVFSLGVIDTVSRGSCIVHWSSSDPV
jgi:hypothetical protein